MLNYTKEHKIPVLIFSAGVGNSIVAILKVNRLMLKNITVSKYMQMWSLTIKKDINFSFRLFPTF